MLSILPLQRVAWTSMKTSEWKKRSWENWYPVAWMPIYELDKSKRPTQGYESDPARAMRLYHDCWRLLLDIFMQTRNTLALWCMETNHGTKHAHSWAVCLVAYVYVLVSICYIQLRICSHIMFKLRIPYKLRIWNILHIDGGDGSLLCRGEFPVPPMRCTQGWF